MAPISTSRAAARIKIREMQDGETDTSRRPRGANMLIAVSNPLTAGPLVELAMMMRLRRSGMEADSLFALHVRNDNTPSAKAVGEHALRLAAGAAAGADSCLETIERFDINTVTGILNTVQERDISQVIVGMHRKVTVIDSFLGSRIEQLLKGTNKMVIISRCYIPVNTVTRIVVSVPPKAEYESGFERWVLSLGALASEVGCRIIFCCHPSQQHIIKGVIRRAGLGIRHEYRDVVEKDDFVLLANRVLDDDLFVVIGARPNSVSHSAEMVEAASLLQRYFSRNNLCLLYPEQFGQEPQLPTFSDPLGSDIATTPSPLWLMIRDRLHRLNTLKKRFTHRNRRSPRA